MKRLNSTTMEGRREIKYLITTSEYHVLSTLLKNVLNSDPYSLDSGDYKVNSLYFDTLDNKDYHDKEIGTYSRTKLRLRCYNSSPSQIKLESKNKEGDVTYKQSISLPTDDYTHIENEHYDYLLERQDAGALYMSLKAEGAKSVVRVDYDREAYMLPFFNVRINFDKNISAVMTDKLIQKDVLLTPILDADKMVLEVKYSHSLPDYIRDILSSVSMTKTTFSKYCIARECC